MVIIIFILIVFFNVKVSLFFNFLTPLCPFYSFWWLICSLFFIFLSLYFCWGRLGYFFGCDICCIFCTSISNRVSVKAETHVGTRSADERGGGRWRNPVQSTGSRQSGRGSDPDYVACISFWVV